MRPTDYPRGDKGGASPPLDYRLDHTTTQRSWPIAAFDEAQPPVLTSRRPLPRMAEPWTISGAPSHLNEQFSGTKWPFCNIFFLKFNSAKFCCTYD
jgi:hypothetical protein